MKSLIKSILIVVIATITITFSSCKQDPGKVVFWTNSNLGCGPIDVTIDGTTNSITSFYSASTPDCGSAGCATFNLGAGTHNWTASCTGLNWSGTITITSNGCLQMLITP
jgi:hypothetical protein